MAVETITETFPPKRAVLPPPGMPKPPDTDYNLVAPDKHAIARNITDSKKIKHKGDPTVAELAEAIVDVELNAAIKDVNHVVITIEDPEWVFLDSTFFDVDQDSQLDAIDINYPDGSRFWYRLTQVSPDSSQGEIKLTFLQREMVWLLHHAGPQKADRAKVTRAEFLKSLCDMASKNALPHEGKIEFYSAELHKKQPIAPFDASVGASAGASPATPAASATASASNMPAGQAAKVPGLGANTASLTIKGGPMRPDQVANVNTILDVGRQNGASTEALVCAIMCSIQENSLTNSITGEGSDPCGGCFCENPITSRSTDLPYQAFSFFTGKGSEAYHDGIIPVLRDNPGIVEWEAIAHVQRPAAQYASLYQQWKDEATRIVTAAGGGGLAGGTAGGGTVIEPYFFEVKKGETFWDAMVRLAAEVNWELFWDGARVYYDDEQTLIKQKPAAEFDRDHEAVVKWSYDWDVRQIVTQMSIDLICEPNEFRAGEVFVLKKFGIGASGSSAKPKPLPGRWLVQDATYSRSNLFSTFTLVQPDLPKLEPAPQVKQGSGGSAAAGPVGQGVAGAVQAAQQLGIKAVNEHWSYDQGQRTLTQAGFKSGTDCSGGVSWILLSAGFPLPNGVSWGGWAPVSGDFESWGQAGPGQQMTVWANADHIFIEFKAPSHAFFDSGHTPSSGNVWWDPSGTLDSSYVSGGSFTPRHWPGT